MIMANIFFGASVLMVVIAIVAVVVMVIKDKKITGRRIS
jgi:hypothetical protein